MPGRGGGPGLTRRGSSAVSEPEFDLLQESGFQEKARLIEFDSNHSSRGFEAGHLMLREPETTEELS